MISSGSCNFRFRIHGILAALMLGTASLLPAAIGTWNGGWPPLAGSYNSGSDANVPITAIVQESPPQITLTLHRAGAYTIFRKVRDETSWGTARATLPAGSTAYVDTNVSVGVTYEYKVVISGVAASPNGVFPTGYLMAGIRVDKTAPRGRVVLVVTDTITTGLPAELDAYKRDLGADGWTVHTITVAPGDYSGSGNLHQAIRTQIQILNTTYPGEVKNVILLGKVPAPRSGISDGLRPDGHESSYAEATDSYYAEMDGNWTDTSANTQTGDVGNIAGDGKYDATRVTNLGTGQMIELGFGRIDTSYGQASHLATTRMYLEKLARYRRAADNFQPGRKGAIRKGFDNVDESGWMNLPSLLGPGKIVAVTSTADLPANPTGRYDTDGLFTRENQQGPFLFYFKGTGYLDSRDDDSRAVFLTGMQSHWGWWAEPTGGGQMVSRLGTDNFTLSVTWSIYGVRYFYHRLGLGGDMGDVLRTTLNNSSWSSGIYSYGTSSVSFGDKNGRLWISHMGDPTLRLFPVRPPTNLTATASGAAGVALSWTNSDDTNLQGVHVYRSPSPTGPWVQLTTAGSPYSGATYVDTPPAPGDWTYSVRAVKLESTPCGTYLNPSLGATVTVQTATAAAPLAIATTTLSASAWKTKGIVSLQATGGNVPYTWSLVGGSLPAGVTLSADGTLSGTPTRGGVTVQPVFKVSDFRGATAQLGYELAVTTRRIVVVPVDADASVRSSVSYKDSNFGISNGLLITKSANSAPLYTDALGYLRFVLPALAEGERVEAARLCFTLGGGSATTTTTTLTAALLADAGDAWGEGLQGGGAGTGTALTYTNRPTALNTSVAAATFLGPLAPNSRVSMDIFPHCAATFSSDPAKIMGLVVSSNTISSLAMCSRENPPAAAPVVELEITHAPAISLFRPLLGAAALPSGQSLVLNSTVADSAPVTNTWTKISGPGVVTFADANSASTSVSFSAPGRYSLLLTSDDGELVSQKLVDVQVVSNSSTIKTDNLVAYYRFDESNGTTATDSAPDGVAHLGTLSTTTGLTWSPTGGRLKGALTFSASNVYVQTPDQDTLDNTNRLSIALWINPTAPALDGNARGLLSKRSGSNNQEAYTMYMLSGRIYARFNSTNITINTTDPVLTGGKWTHIAAVYDGTKSGTSGCVVIYVNGVAVPLSGGNETDSSIPNTTSALWIGQMNGGSTTYTFLGLLDEVRIYRNRALTATDVGDLLAAEAPRLTITGPIENPLSGGAFALTGSMTDAGLPLSADLVSLQWTKATGSPAVTFTAPTALSTNATVTGDGFITLRLTADDGAAATFLDTSLTVMASTLNYAAWSAQFSWPAGADSTASGDPDGDGFANLLEYAFNFDPLAADPASHHPSVSTSGGHLALAFIRDPALSSLVYEVQASSNFSANSWTTIARTTAGGTTTDVDSGTLSINETTDGDLIRVTVVDATPLASAPRRFLRLHVAQP